MSVETVKQEVESVLNKLRPLFTPECELTFVMRHKSNGDCHMVVSNDNLVKVATTLLTVSNDIHVKAAIIILNRSEASDET